jgi:hypothetical protein
MGVGGVGKGKHVVVDWDLPAIAIAPPTTTLFYLPLARDIA